MLSNGADPATANDMITKDFTGATALNNTTFDFRITYESGDDGVQGFTFLMTQVGGPRDSTLVYDVNNPLNGQTPTGGLTPSRSRPMQGHCLTPPIKLRRRI